MIIYTGPSMLDGAPITGIITGLAGSANRKTGAMAQLWILRADVSPIDAVKSGADSSICGGCPHRGIGTKKRTCYVNVGQAPGSIYRAYKRGRYSVADPRMLLRALEGKQLRLGAYGDPAALPPHVVQAVTQACAGWSGYTHQWRAADWLRGYCMASVDSEAEAIKAQAAGWRTFRVAKPEDKPRLARESICPAAKEAGAKLTCSQCMACCGANGRRGSIVIQAHGSGASASNLAALTSRINA